MANKDGTPCVVYVHEMLRDGHEEWAKIFNSTDAALNYINELGKSFFQHGYSYRLFKLGEEIPLACKTVKQKPKPTPAEEKTVYYIEKLV